jgi:hypothetical protein
MGPGFPLSLHSGNQSSSAQRSATVIIHDIPVVPDLAPVLVADRLTAYP